MLERRFCNLYYTKDFLDDTNKAKYEKFDAIS